MAIQSCGCHSPTDGWTWINTNPTGSDNPQSLTAVGSNLFVRASDGSGYQDLWMVNSSGAATQINTNPAGSDDPYYLTAVREQPLPECVEQWRHAKGPVDGQFLGGRTPSQHQPDRKRFSELLEGRGE